MVSPLRKWDSALDAVTEACHVLVLLRRYRAGDTDESVLTGIHLTVNGIAAGLRNSG